MNKLKRNYRPRRRKRAPDEPVARATPTRLHAYNLERWQLDRLSAVLDRQCAPKLETEPDWYCVRTHPGGEFAAQIRLDAAGVRSWTPVSWRIP